MTTTTTGLTLAEALDELATWGELTRPELPDALEDLVNSTSMEQAPGFEFGGPHLTNGIAPRTQNDSPINNGKNE